MHITRDKSRKKAFTLIELVTVMVILGITAIVVAGPTLSYLNDMQVDAAASRLTADIRYLQHLALGSRLSTWLSVDLANNRYSLFREDAANPGKAGRLALTNPLDQTTGPIQFGSGAFANVTLSSADFNATTELEFDSFGVPYDNNGVALSSAGQVVISNKIVVKVHPVGGFVEAVKWP